MTEWNSQGRMKIKENRTMSRSPRIQNIFRVTQPEGGKESSSSVSLMEAGNLSTLPLRRNSGHRDSSEMFDLQPGTEYRLKSEIDCFPRMKDKGYGKKRSDLDTVHHRVTPEEDALSYLDDVLSEDIDCVSFADSNTNMNSNKQNAPVSISHK